MDPELYQNQFIILSKLVDRQTNTQTYRHENITSFFGGGNNNNNNNNNFVSFKAALELSPRNTWIQAT